ncbi:hypothetical protein A2V68_02240 [candidate division Kazan bacterium RBG_13_50_9]|uniref:Cell division protein FtsX n=1 Tax=candidate division Kazan bacterium RBG_13_50_9 TaxID=1798535 RepID=A0A1F4NRS2_UNCK3|nr:MAG: hypothetical protein A2V68_02240 [candidate division Kazan bacterium RBG_13_50_9]
MQLILRIFRTSWQGFKRNGWLSFVSTFTMMQALLLLTIFISLNVAVDTTIKAINERIDVAVFFKEYVPEADILAFRDKINAIPEVKSITYVSQQEALESYIAQNSGSQELLDVIGEDKSFLPASLEVKVDNPYQIEETVSKVHREDTGGIILETSLQKNQDVIDRLRRINRMVGVANVALSTIFIIIALLIIFNTIRITIFTRREEIEIMKLVGATDWYIRWPFIIEGTIYGIAGALFAFLMTVVGYWLITSSLGTRYFALDVAGVGQGMFGPWFALSMFAIQLAFGIVVGAVSSYLSTKRHLRV